MNWRQHIHQAFERDARSRPVDAVLRPKKKVRLDLGTHKSVAPSAEVLEQRFKEKANALMAAALQIPEIQAKPDRPSNNVAHRSWWVGDVDKNYSAEDCFGDALRAMDVEENNRLRRRKN